MVCLSTCVRTLTFCSYVRPRRPERLMLGRSKRCSGYWYARNCGCTKPKPCVIGRSFHGRATEQSPTSDLSAWRESCKPKCEQWQAVCQRPTSQRLTTL